MSADNPLKYDKSLELSSAGKTSTPDANGTVIQYQASHTCQQFHEDPSFIRGIMGPIGSGKSVACTMELFRLACDQAPHKGVRYSRCAVIRNTYGELKTTTIKTFQQWIPESICPITWSSPIKAVLGVPHPSGDGTRVACEFLFVSMDRPRDVRKVLSLELTFAWLNEARELGRETLDAVQSRLGRYPGMNLGGYTRKSLIMDTNPPDTAHWWYKLAELERPENWAFFKQPGGLIYDIEAGGYRANPNAENIRNLGGQWAYYMDQVAGKIPDWIKVYLLGDYGSIFTGRPVYEHYWKHDYHVSDKKLEIIRGLPLILGWDFGLTPACLIGQLTPGGQLRVLRELFVQGAGVKQFAGDHVKPLLMNDFMGMKIHSVGDPAGTAGSQHDSEISCMSQLASMGIPTVPASTNAFGERRQSTINFLAKNVGGEPGMIVDPSCQMFIDGMDGGYQFNRIEVGGEERYKDTPNKNRFSHIADAGQYLCLGCESGFGMFDNQEPLQAQVNINAAYAG